MGEACRTQAITISVWLFVCVMYLCVGMVVFVALEDTKTTEIIQQKKTMQHELKTEIQSKLNLSEKEFTALVERTVKAYSPIPTRWTYIHSFAFVFQTITTIGYGYITPITDGGRLFCVFYALFGIPLAALLLQSTGKALFQIIVSFIVWLEKKVIGKVNIKNAEEKSFLGSFLLLCFVVVLYAVVFVRYYKQGTFVEGVYSWFVTLTTIGYGDIVPGHSTPTLTSISLRVIFIVVGLSVTSSVLNSIATCIEKRRNKTAICKSCSGRVNGFRSILHKSSAVEITGERKRESPSSKHVDTTRKEGGYELNELKPE